jgi:hypothetical protein
MWSIGRTALGSGRWRASSSTLPPSTGATRELGVISRRLAGAGPPVDDPWRAVAEYVIGSDGLVRLCYAYQHCEDCPSAGAHNGARLS